MATVVHASKSSLDVGTTRGGELRVERTDIDFRNSGPGVVEIRIRVTNVGSERSRPTFAMISAAPLGAFVAWQPLVAVSVPGLDPDVSIVVEKQVREQPVEALGTPDRVPPRQALVALGAGDNDQPRRRSAAPATLPTDLFKLLSQGSPHWAGNLNVFVAGQSVERHRAMALRVYPGRTNLAMFVVGSFRDAYSFELTGSAAAWDAMLYDFTGSRSFVPDGDGPKVRFGEWIDLRGHAMMILALRPPATASRGAVEVHVRQRSTDKTAIVEFTLDASAAGPGCYAV